MLVSLVMHRSTTNAEEREGEREVNTRIYRARHVASSKLVYMIVVLINAACPCRELAKRYAVRRYLLVGNSGAPIRSF